MPFDFSPHEQNESFFGDNIIITNERKLVELVTLTLMARYDHVNRILSSMENPKIIPKRTVIESIIKNILHVKDFYHRDGLLFQHISWVISARRKDEYDILKAPHCRIADKGQDLIVLHIDKNKNLNGITICEDKASENVRDTIRDQVFPEFQEYDSGNRDSELESEVLSLLKENFGTDQANNIIEKIFWEDNKRFRITISVDTEDSSKIFKGYEKIIQGKKNRRNGNTVKIQDLRIWFDHFSDQIEKNLKKYIEE